MNFFKSVFSVDPDSSDSSSEGNSSESAHKLQENEEGEEETHALMPDYRNPINKSNLKPNTPWVGLGTLIKTFASKSESVIQTYRRDLEEFSSGLKKETEAIREAATRAVRDLPNSLEVGASAAQESLESVGQAIDDFGGSVWRGTAEIISEGKDAFLSVDSDAETHSSDIQTPFSGGVTFSASKRYSRFEAQVLAMQSDPSTFSEEPEDDLDFRKWMSEFELKEKEDEIEVLCYENGTLEGLFEKLVPSVVDYDTFWSRYFYKIYKLKQAEDVRANLVKRVISREDDNEDLTWEVDDDEERKEEKNRENDDKSGRTEDISEEHEANVETEVESKSGHVEEGTEMGLENREVINIEFVEENKKKGDTEEIELTNKKKSVGAPEVVSLEVTAAIDNDILGSTSGLVDDIETGKNSLITRSGNNVLQKASSGLVESSKYSDISTVSSQSSMPEEEDLGWDEIEDLGEHDDKKIGESNSTINVKYIHERVNVAEDDDDLTWDIEDDD